MSVITTQSEVTHPIHGIPTYTVVVASTHKTKEEAQAHTEKHGGKVLTTIAAEGSRRRPAVGDTVALYHEDSGRSYFIYPLI